MSDLQNIPSKSFTNLEKSVIHHFNHPTPEEGVLLLSIDARYLDLYGEKLLESFAYWNPGGLIHIHCVNFEPEQIHLSSLETTYGLQINYSVDQQAGLEEAPHLYAGYCAGARYLYLPRYLEHYGKVAISDIDGVIRTSLAALWNDGNRAIQLTSKLIPQNGRLLGCYGRQSQPIHLR